MALHARIEVAAVGDDPAALLALSFDFQRAACEIAGNDYFSGALANLVPSFSRAHYRVLAAGRTEMRALAAFIDGVMTAVLAHHRDVVLGTYPQGPAGVRHNPRKDSFFQCVSGVP